MLKIRSLNKILGKITMARVSKFTKNEETILYTYTQLHITIVRKNLYCSFPYNYSLPFGEKT